MDRFTKKYYLTYKFTTALLLLNNLFENYLVVYRRYETLIN